jgi:hypothetical protein
MNTLATQLQELATALGTADQVVTAFQALRDFCSDEQWDELTSSGPLADLLDACSDLECDLKR